MRYLIVLPTLYERDSCGTFQAAVSPLAPVKDPAEKTIPKKYRDGRVILVNDDWNTFEHVITALVKCVPGLGIDEAGQLAYQAHSEGSSVVYKGHPEVCEMVASQLRSEGLTAHSDEGE
jgi:ATP-dependent Clp protease adaptor protein ClpS